MPVTLIRAMGPGSVVDDEDEAEFLRRLPNATIVHVPTPVIRSRATSHWSWPHYSSITHWR